MIIKCKITNKCMLCGIFSKISQTPKNTRPRGEITPYRARGGHATD